MYTFPLFFYGKTLCFVSENFNKISECVSTFIILCICGLYLSCVKVRPVLPMNLTRTILKFLRVGVIQNAQIIVFVVFSEESRIW